MASDTASFVDEQQAQLVTTTSTDNRGRHRILAELNRLEQNSNSCRKRWENLKILKTFPPYVRNCYLTLKAGRSSNPRNKWTYKSNMGSMV